jgi:DNA (cytosine-5)-methyltransferase 1
LDKRLRDVLEKDVDEKYYLSEKMMNYLNTRKDNFNGGKINYKNENDVASCINASSKSIDISDNIIIEKVGFINQDTQASQVYGTDGISPTLSAGTHGYAHGYIKVKEATKKGYDIAEPGDSINMSNPNSTTPRGRVGKGIANTLDTSCNQAVIEPLLIKFSRTENAKKQRKETGTNNFQDKQIEFVKLDISNTITTVQKDNLIIEPQLNQIAQIEGFESEGRVYDANGLARTIKDGGGGGSGSKTGWYDTGAKIRRLLPIETFRLQGYSDEFFYKCQAVNSDTRLYQQAGNTITVSVIQAIIKNLLHILK